jgi:hypothetical protein
LTTYPPILDIYYLISIDKKSTFFGLPTHLFLAT